jgi:hypothetical protein
MRNLLYFLLISILATACHKSNDTKGTLVKTTPTIAYKVDSSQVQPGELVTITSDSIVSKDTCTLSIDGKQILLVKTDSFHLAFLMPVLASGQYDLDMTTLGGGNSVSLSVSNYATIGDPGSVVSSALSSYYLFADSIAADTMFDKTAAGDALLVQQLADGLSQQISALSQDQKESLAYFIQYNQAVVNMAAQTNSIKKKIQVLGGPGNQVNSVDPLPGVISDLDNFNNKKSAAISSSGTLAIAIILFAVEPANPITAGVAVIALAKYLNNVRGARDAIGQAFSRLCYTINVSLDDNNGNPEPASTILDVTSGIPVSHRYSMTMRTLERSDASDGNATISSGITGGDALQTKDQYVQSLFDGIKNKLNSIIGNITATYNAFTSPVPQIGATGQAETYYPDFSVSKVSNPDLQVQLTGNNANGLGLSVSNPADDIDSVDFTFQLTYTQQEVNNAVNIEQPALFIQSGAYTVVTTTPITNITGTSANSGGTITVNGGSGISSRGLCFNTSGTPTINDQTVLEGYATGTFTSVLVNLTTNTNYFVRAFAIDSSGHVYYGNQQPLMTAPTDQYTNITLNCLTNQTCSDGTCTPWVINFGILLKLIINNGQATGLILNSDNSNWYPISGSVSSLSADFNNGGTLNPARYFVEHTYQFNGNVISGSGTFTEMFLAESYNNLGQVVVSQANITGTFKPE